MTKTDAYSKKKTYTLRKNIIGDLDFPLNARYIILFERVTLWPK